MTEEQIALARRAVACKGWRWLPGMLAVRVEEPPFVSEGFDASKLLNRTYRVLHITERGMVHCYAEAFRAASTAYAPDLTDPATLGCLLALVREAWGNKHLWVDVGVDPAMWSLTVYSIGWACVDGEVPIPADIQAESEAEALVAALEAAP